MLCFGWRHVGSNMADGLNNASLETNEALFNIDILYDRIGPGAPCQSCWSWHAQQALPTATPCRVSKNPSSEGTES